MNMFPTDHDHDPAAIQARLSEQTTNPDYIREWVYGGIDGVVTTFAIVAGVTGAALSPAIVIILGLANLIGDGFSMAAGAYNATKTETDNFKRLQAVEERHIARNPEGEREEVRQIFAAKGFTGDMLEKIVKTITSDRKLWVETMMVGEYGMTAPGKTAIKAAIHTFLAFILCGAMPLLPYLLGTSHAFYAALCLSAATFFLIGSLKSLWSVRSWLRCGFETTFIGMIAAGIAFSIGYALRGLGAS